MDMLEISQIDGRRHLRLAGELDLHTANELKDTFAMLQGDGPATLDLSELTFVDSSGLHAIVAFATSENGNGPVILDGVSATMMRMLEITNVAEHPNLEVRARVDGD
jgi:anti-anti-sigma factor